MLKFVKKISMFVLVALSVVVLASCIGGSGTKDSVTVEISGIKDAYEFNTGDEFSKDILLKDIKVLGSDGKDYKDKLVVSGLDRFKTDENGKLIDKGSGNVKIEVVVDGQTIASKIISVKVNYVAPDTDDIIKSGDFASGTGPFSVTEAENGQGTIEVVNGELKLTVDVVSSNGAFPRIDSNVFTLEAGKYYEYSFDIRANVATSVQIQIGELLSSDPWFNELLLKTYAVTTEMQTITYCFKARANAGYDLTKLQLLFGFGTHEGFDSECTDVFMDNIKIEEVDSTKVVDNESPVITAANKNAYVGSEINVEKLYSVSDNFDDEPTATATIKDADGNVVETIDSSKVGEYTVTVVAKDNASNESTASFKVTIKEKDNSTKTITNGKREDSVNNGGWIEWHDQNWCGSTVTLKEGKQSPSEIVVDYTQSGECWYGMQLFYSDATVTPGKYTVTLSVNASVAGKVTICGNVVELKAGDNEIEIEATLVENNVSFEMQFGVMGTEDGTVPTSQISKGKFVLSNLKIGETVVLGQSSKTPLTNGEEHVSVSNGGWIEWHDQSWVASNVTLNEATIAADVVTIDFVQTIRDNKTEADAWFGMQLFYTDTALELVKHTIKLKINASVAGSVTINGQVIELKVGNNDIEIVADLNVKDGDGKQRASLFMQFGVYNNSAITEGKFVLSGLTFEKYEDSGSTVDPADPTPSTSAKLPDMVGLVANKVENSVTVAWAGNTYNDYEVAGYKLTVKSSDETVVHTNDNVTNGYNFSIADFEADTYTVEIVALGNGTSTSDSNAATATFTVEGTTDVDPEPSETPDTPVTGNTIRILTEGSSETRFESAGAWIWFDLSSVGMTNENYLNATISATVDVKDPAGNPVAWAVVDKLVSDHNFDAGYARIYVSLQGAPVEGYTTAISLTLVLNDTTYTATVNFSGTTYVA